MRPAPERPLPRWMDFFTIGKMPLPLAWIVAWVLGIGATFLMVTVAADSPLDAWLFFGWLLAPAVGTSFVAARKGRRRLFWSLLVIVLFLVGVFQPYIQPIMAFLAVTLAGKPPVRIPEAELEADESPSAMQSLAFIRKDVATIQAEMAEEYVRRDIGRLRARVPQMKKVEQRIDGVALQKSVRGQRARLHVSAATRILLRVGETAAAIEELVMANPDLQPVIQGRIGGGRGKPARQLTKSLARLEEMVGRSNNQLLVASAVLDALGYQDPEPQTLEPPADDAEKAPADDDLSRQPALDRARPRSRRRQRF